jgi:hypothetical protein
MLVQLAQEMAGMESPLLFLVFLLIMLVGVVAALQTALQ